MEYNLKRPKRINEEDEDELLRFQEEFLKNKSNQQPAAKVVKRETNVIDETQKGSKLTDKKSKFHIDFQEDKNAYEAVLTDIVLEIKEKPLRNDFSREINAETEFEQIKVEKINLNELKSQLSQDKRKNKSLFAQNLEAKGKLKAYYQLNQVYQPNRVLENDDKIKSIEKHLPTIVTESGSRKQLITGEGVGNVKDAEQIHVENLELLAKMTPDEIIAEQKKLVEQLDPKLVAFIRKRSDKTTSANSQNETVSLEENETPKIEPDKILEELGMKPYKSWLQMEKIEFEKLEWMLNKSMKRKVEVGESSVPARFDFSGNLMRPDEEISTRAGLHHHGNDPDSPGYSLDELFLLARSKFTQQRTLAIQTLANVVSKCHQGAYTDQIKSAGETATNKDQIDDENNLLYQLIDGGLLLLLRLSLDEQTESIISASLSALKCLLQPTGQEEAFDRQFDLDPFVRVDSLHPFSSFFAELDSKKPTGFKVDNNLNLSEKRELSELKDDEYIKQDLVSGLMRMNLIERFRYLLGMYQPQLTYKLITNNMFSILFRLMRHSAEFTFEFMKKYSQFIDSLASNFLPLFINGEGDNDLANVANMVKLIRLLASTGPSLAQTLYNKYSLKEKLINYLTCDKYVKNELDLVGQLQIESIRLLKTFIVYSNQNNSNIGVDCFYDCYELLLKKLSAQISNSNDEISSSLLVTLFHVYLRTTNSNPDVNSSVFSILSTFVTDQFKAAQSTESIKKVSLLSVCLSYSVDYLEKSTTSDRNSRIDVLSKHLIDPFLGSNEGVLALERLVLSRLQSSSVNSESMRENFQKIAFNNLSYLPTAMVIQSADDCFFRLVTSYLRFYQLAIIRLKKTNVEEKRFSNVHRLMANDYLRSYFRAFLKNCSQDTNKELLLNRQENLFVYNAVRLMFQVYNLEESEEKIETTKGKKLFLQLALSLIPKFKHGEEHIFHDLIATCLFNMSFWSEYLLGESNSSATNENVLINHFSTLKLEERCENSSSSSSGGESELVSAQSIKSFERVHIYECLNQVKLAYLSEGSLMQRRAVEHSRLLVDASSSATLFTSPRYSARPIASVDWMYAPIVNVLEAYESQKKGFKIEVTKSSLSIITNCLKYIYLMETHMSSDYMDIHINPARRFVRLLYVYLLEADIFLDKQVRTMLYLIYFKYAKLSIPSRPFLSHLDLDARSIDSLLSFEDLYRALLANYDSTSFGDYVFSLYLVVPLQTAYSMKYRQIFWSDYSHLFKYLKFDTPSTQLLIGLNSFVQPNEKSLHMIRLYAQVLLDPMEFQHTINSKLAYTIIVANLNSFIFEHINQVERKVEFEFKRLLVKQFLAFSNEKLKTDLINYKCVNETTSTIELYEELPLIRKQWINQLNI